MNPSEQLRSANASSDPEKLQEYSPTIKNILEGRSTIKFLSKTTETRAVMGREWIGTAYLYELTVPNPVRPDEEWATFLTAWWPLNLAHEPYVEFPRMQLTIQTGKGEMALTANTERRERVLEEISRQVSETAQKFIKLDDSNQ